MNFCSFKISRSFTRTPLVNKTMNGQNPLNALWTKLISLLPVPGHGHPTVNLARYQKIHKIIKKSRFYYINGLRDLFAQIDMVLTFHFRQGLPRKCLYKSP